MSLNPRSTPVEPEPAPCRRLPAAADNARGSSERESGHSKELASMRWIV